MSGRTNRVGSHPAHEVEMATVVATVEEMRKVEHNAALDLRMVQVGAVAVAREALRLAAEVAAGRANAAHVRAVMTGCLNIPEVNAEALLTAPLTAQPVSRVEVLREALDALGTLSVSYIREGGVYTLCMDSPVSEVPLLRVHGLSENDAGHAERAARAAFSAAQDIVNGMVKKAENPRVSNLDQWLRRFACKRLGMALVEAEAMDLNDLMERARQHMEASPESGAYARAAEEKRAAVALAREDATGSVFPMPSSTLPNAPLVLVTALRSWMDGEEDRTEVDVRIEAQHDAEMVASVRKAARAIGWFVLSTDVSAQNGKHWTATLRKKSGVDPLTLRPEDIAGARVASWSETKDRLTLLLKDSSARALANLECALKQHGFRLEHSSLKQDPSHITRDVELGGELTDVIHNQTWTIEAQR